MVIEVRLYASLRRSLSSLSDTGVITVDVPNGIRLGELLEEMEISASEVSTMMINGQGGRKASRLTDGDRVELFPPDFSGKG